MFLGPTGVGKTELARALRAPDVRERLAADGAEPSPSTPEQFGAYIKTEIDKWTKVIRSANIAPE